MNQDKKEQIKQWVSREYIKCKDDPIYMIKKYFVVIHQNRGRVKFELYDYQEQVLNSFFNEQLIVILKARQLGLSTLTAAYVLYKMLFQPDFHAVVVATKTSIAINIIKKVKLMYNELPRFLKMHKKIGDNAMKLELSNGSIMSAVSSASDSVRSESLNLLVMDECSFIPRAEELWAGASPSITGAKQQAFLISTPNGVGNLYHKVWSGAETGTNNFVPIKLHWSVHPEHDQAWRDNEDRILGKKKAAQENDCIFESSGTTVVNLKLLKKYKERAIEPIEKIGIDNNLWIFKRPEPSSNYIISADCATAHGDDFSAAHVIDVDTLEQVAEYKGHIDPFKFGSELLHLAVHYNNAILAIENNSIGIAAVQSALDENYNNLFWTKRGSVDWVDPNEYNLHEEKDIKPGFTTTGKSRPLIIQNMDTLVNNEDVIINSNRLLQEFETFIVKNGKAIAMDTYHDDLIMAYSIGLWVRNVSMRVWRNMRQAEEDNRSWLLKGFQTDKRMWTNRDQKENPYKQKVSTATGKTETIDWSVHLKRK